MAIQAAKRRSVVLGVFPQGEHTRLVLALTDSRGEAVRLEVSEETLLPHGEWVASRRPLRLLFEDVPALRAAIERGTRIARDRRRRAVRRTTRSRSEGTTRTSALAQLGARVEVGDLARIDLLAAKLDTSRNETIRRALRLGLRTLDGTARASTSITTEQANRC